MVNGLGASCSSGRRRRQVAGQQEVFLEFECLEDRTLPSLSVLSIDGAAPLAAITNATAVAYALTFNEAATGVDPTDFRLVYGGTVGSTLTQVMPVTAAVYTVSISGISGNGTLGLNLVDNGTIHDTGGGGLGGVGFTGQLYTIEQARPFVQSIARTTPAGSFTNASSVSYTVTFSEPVTGVDAADFQLVFAGTVAAASTQVTPVSGAVYTFAISGITGDGTLGLNLVDNGSIVDAASNPLTQSNALAVFQAQQTYATGSVPVAMVTADVNGDGIPDLVIANRSSNTVSVLLGNGNGTFQHQLTFATGTFPDAVACADVTGDGKVDIVVLASQYGTVSVLLGNGNGTFQAQQTFGITRGPDSLVVGDVNGDGKPDIAVAYNYKNTVGVFLGDGNGTFQAPQTFATGSHPNSLALGDLNGNGKPDLAVVNASDNTVGVFLGNGDGTFQVQHTFAVQPGPGAVAFGDVNGDSIHLTWLCPMTVAR